MVHVYVCVCVCVCVCVVFLMAKMCCCFPESSSSLPPWQADDQPEEVVERGPFRRYVYRGVEVSELASKTQAELLPMFHARARRRFSHGLSPAHVSLVKKLRKARKNLGADGKPPIVMVRFAWPASCVVDLRGWVLPEPEWVEWWTVRPGGAAWQWTQSEPAAECVPPTSTAICRLKFHRVRPPLFVHASPFAT